MEVSTFDKSEYLNEIFKIIIKRKIEFVVIAAVIVAAIFYFNIKSRGNIELTGLLKIGYYNPIAISGGNSNKYFEVSKEFLKLSIFSLEDRKYEIISKKLVQEDYPDILKITVITKNKDLGETYIKDLFIPIVEAHKKIYENYKTFLTNWFLEIDNFTKRFPIEDFKLKGITTTLDLIIGNYYNSLVLKRKLSYSLMSENLVPTQLVINKKPPKSFNYLNVFFGFIFSLIVSGIFVLIEERILESFRH